MGADQNSRRTETRVGEADIGKILYERYLNGEKNAFVQIIEMYKDPLMLFIRTFVKDILIAEELTQETFVRIGLEKPSFHGKCGFKTWLYSIGRNVSVGYIRKHTREQLTESGGFECFTNGEADIEQEYLKEDDKITVHRAMNHLSPIYRRVLWLSYFEELNNEEIARIMKKTKHAVEALKCRAKQALKNELKKEGFIYENG